MSDTNHARFAADLNTTPVIAILRGVTPRSIIGVCDTLIECGIRFIEITLNSPVEPLTSIRLAAERYAREGVHIGAGTVMTPDQVEQVLEAGGTYIISPNVNKTVVRRARELNLISIPGFFTPSEAFAAVDAGADYLKCFPAGVLGAPYLQYLRGVLATPVIAVGGVTADNVQDYLNTAAGVGIGSSVYKPELTSDEIGEIAGRFMKSVGGSR